MATPLGVNIPSIEQLQANQLRLLQQGLAQAAQASGALQAASAADLELARSNNKVIAFVLALGLHGLYRYLRDFVARQAVPVYSTDEGLTGWLATFGMSRKPSAMASGQVIGSGVPGEQLLTGTLLQADDGRQYSVTADATVLLDNSITASVRAVLAGNAANLDADMPLTLVTSVPGVDAAFLTASPNGIYGGADAEKDGQAIARLKQRLANEPMGGSPADYARWAMEVPGITRAWGLRAPEGPCTAGVIIMADDNAPYGLPTVGQQTQVYDYIREPQRGPPDDLYVILPTEEVIDFTIHLVPDSSAVRQAVVTALQDLFKRECTPGGYLPYSHVKETISAVVGEYNHTISAPTLAEGGTFTVANYEHILVLGAVSFI